MTGDSSNEADRQGQQRKRRLDVSPAQVTGGALASVTAAFLGSQMGSAGTILGAGMTSVVITVGGALYQRSLENAKDKAKDAANKAVVLRQRRPSAPTTVLESPGAVESVTRVAGRSAGVADPATSNAPGYRPTGDSAAGQRAAGHRAGGSAPDERPAGSARELDRPPDNRPTRRADRPNGMVWPGGEQVVDEEPPRRRTAECFDHGRRQHRSGSGDTGTSGAGVGNADSGGSGDTSTVSDRGVAAGRTSYLGRGAGVRKLAWDGTQYVPREQNSACEVAGADDPGRAARPDHSRSTTGADALAEPSRASADSPPSGRSSGGTAVAREPGGRAEPVDEVAPAPKRRRGLRWTVLVVSSALIFALGMLVVTGYEALTGRPLSGGDSGTTIGRAFHPQPAPEPEVEPDGGAETTAPSTEPEPTETPESEQPGAPAESGAPPSDDSTSAEPSTSTGSDGSSSTGEQSDDGETSGVPMPGAPGPGAGPSGQPDTEQPGAGLLDGATGRGS